MLNRVLIRDGESQQALLDVAHSSFESRMSKAPMLCFVMFDGVSCHFASATSRSDPPVTQIEV